MSAKWTIANDAVNPPLNLTERSAAPSSPELGDIYLDDGTNTANGVPAFRRYNGSTWEDMGGGGAIASLTLAGDTGSEALAQGDTITIAGGTGISTAVAATDTATVNMDINGLTAETAVDQDADWLGLHDTSEGTINKVLVSDLLPFAVLQDVKVNSTAGGSASASTWNVRDLNTEIVDDDNIVTIASNQFTPIAGKYLLTAFAPAYQVDGSLLALYNATGASYVIEGPQGGASSTNSSTVMFWLVASFTANGTDAYEIHHWTTTAKATNGLGVITAGNANERYLTVYLYKVG